MTPSTADIPDTAAWRHLQAREGFEVLFLSKEEDGYRLEGHSTAVEDGEAWGIRYTVALDANWVTRSARIASRTHMGELEVQLECDGAGTWRVDGLPAPLLTGCLDVDLEASACTNALPVRRLMLGVGQRADAPAAYVRATTLRVERLEQTYSRLPDNGDTSRYDYAAPAFDFAAVLVYDRCSLVVDYPGIAVRVA